MKTKANQSVAEEKGRQNASPVCYAESNELREEYREQVQPVKQKKRKNK